MKINKDEFISFLSTTYPNAKCALNFSTPFQCIVAVSLSAQTTDKSVNQVTPSLFSSFPSPKEMALASVEEIEFFIRKLGLFHNKARNLSLMSKYIMEKWNGEVRLDFDELVKLPGVGRKTVNVVLAETIARPAIAVDTHVSRVAKRLNLAKDNDDNEIIENKLEKLFPKDLWISLHHKMIFFGRYMCHAQSPECNKCKLHSYCRYYMTCSSKIAK